MINVFLKCKKLESHVNSKEAKFGLLKIYVKCAIKNTAYIKHMSIALLLQMKTHKLVQKQGCAMMKPPNK